MQWIFKWIIRTLAIVYCSCLRCNALHPRCVDIQEMLTFDTIRLSWRHSLFVHGCVSSPPLGKLLSLSTEWRHHYSCVPATNDRVMASTLLHHRPVSKRVSCVVHRNVPRGVTYSDYGRGNPEISAGYTHFFI